MKTLIRLVLALVIIVGLASLFFGYWAGSSRARVNAPSGAATDSQRSGVTEADRQRARERGAEVGEKVAAAGERVRELTAEGSLVAKIKSKMALDDTVQARSIAVSVDGDVVTLTGAVRSSSERERALALARETQGVRSVVDHLQVRP
jgi:hyperosmotically inducible protein